jgi:hypothetical protein
MASHCGWSRPGLFGLSLAMAVAITACASSPAAPREGSRSPDSTVVKVQGELTTAGVECPAMRADNGSVYTLLGDLKGFKVGDRVIVEGTPVEISFCMQGTTLKVTQITRKTGGS